MKGRAITYTAEELDWIAERRTWSRDALHRAFVGQFGRSDVSRVNLNSLCKRKGWMTGRTGCFAKGQAPANKGKPCAEGRGGRHPNARRTQFVKGAKPHTWRGAGHERIDAKDGYVILIVDEPNPWTGAATRPVHKHRWLWEKANGPIPKGKCLKCLDGDKTNTDPSNWTLIDRGVLPHLNGGRHKKRLAFDEAAPELKPVLMTAAKLKHAVHQRRKGSSESATQ